MRRILALFCLTAFTLTLAAQSAAGPTAKSKAPVLLAPSAPTQVVTQQVARLGSQQAHTDEERACSPPRLAVYCPHLIPEVTP